MTNEAKPLVGTWTKTTRSTCSATYPDRIQFRENGQYRGQKDTPGEFTAWDVGTFRAVDATHVKISTANDEIISYEFTIKDDVLTFVDPQSCTIAYRREPV